MARRSLTRTAWLEDHASALGPEQRREHRRTAAGELRLLLDDPRPLQIEGRLVDSSDHGFRAAHQFTALQAGQEVCFLHSNACGRARVMWNRVLLEHVESGFLILG